MLIAQRFGSKKWDGAVSGELDYTVCYYNPRRISCQFQNVCLHQRGSEYDAVIVKAFTCCHTSPALTNTYAAPALRSRSSGLPLLAAALESS